MISLSEALSLAKECQTVLVGGLFLRMTCIEERKWLLEFVKEEEKLRLLICLKRPFARFHLSTLLLEGNSSPWTTHVEKYLSQTTIEECHLLGDDRLLELTFVKDDKRYFLLFELFSSKAFVLDGERKIVASFPFKRVGIYHIPTRSFEPTPERAHCTSAAIEKEYAEKEALAALKEKKERITKGIQRKLKGAKAACEKAALALNEAQSWREREHIAQLLKANFPLLKRGMTHISVEDWESKGALQSIPLDPTLTSQEQVDAFFKRARKLKKSLPHAELQLAKWTEVCEALEKAFAEVSKLTTSEELDRFAKKWNLCAAAVLRKPRAEPKKRLPYRSFTTEKGLTILAAKSDKDGDTLTFTIANGLDYWLHVSNYPGSHVVLQVKKGEDPDQESVLDAAQLALYYSKAKKAGSAEITLTQVKNVRKPRGAKAGLVNVSLHKTITCFHDKRRLQRLLSN